MRKTQFQILYISFSYCISTWLEKRLRAKNKTGASKKKGFSFKDRINRFHPHQVEYIALLGLFVTTSMLE